MALQCVFGGILPLHKVYSCDCVIRIGWCICEYNNNDKLGCVITPVDICALYFICLKILMRVFCKYLRNFERTLSAWPKIQWALGIKILSSTKALVPIDFARCCSWKFSICIPTWHSFAAQNKTNTLVECQVDS